MTRMNADQSGGLRRVLRNHAFLPLVVEREALELRLRTEVEQQSDFHRCRSEVVQQLRLERGVDRARRLQLQNNQTFSHKIGKEYADLMASEPNGNRHLPLDPQSRLRKRQLH